MTHQFTDPYVYPGTHTLKNKLNIRDADLLEQVELKIFTARASEPLPPGNFDYSYLKAAHQHLFGDLYEWAGK